MVKRMAKARKGKGGRGRATIAMVSQQISDLARTFELQFGKVGEQLGKVGEQLAALRERLDRVEQRLDRVEQRLDRVEQRLDSHDQEFARIHLRLEDLDDRVRGQGVLLERMEESNRLIAERVASFEQQLKSGLDAVRTEVRADNSALGAALRLHTAAIARHDVRLEGLERGLEGKAEVEEVRQLAQRVDELGRDR